MRKNRAVYLLLALALVAAACGDSAGDTTTTAAVATTTTAPAATTAPPETTMALPAVDIGVDFEAGKIYVGMLSDLTGPFGPLVTPIVDGHSVYWENVNANGGINGLEVELVVKDTQYIPDNHVQFYGELKEEVVAFGHSTGSPHTMAIREALEADGILAVPLTWYSGWSDPALNSNLVPHGAPYCIEAMNVLEYLSKKFEADNGAKPSLAIVSVPGDYGLDSAIGAALAAAALGLEVVYDGTGKVIPPAAGTTFDPTEFVTGIVGGQADIAFVTATPGTFSGIYGGSLAQGFEGIWSGAAPSWNPAFIGPDSPIRGGIARDFWGSAYISPWSSDAPGMKELRDLFAELRPDAPAHDYYGEGFVEASILHAALQKAYDNGDLTQAGVVAAAKSLENVDFGGIGPAETYVGEPNDRLQRQSLMFRPDPADLDAGGSGTTVVEDFFTSDIAAAYEFTGACYKLEG